MNCGLPMHILGVMTARCKWFMEILKYFKTPFLKCFMKFLIFIIKRLKTFKNMIKVYEFGRKYIMLFMHNNNLPLTGLLTLLQWTIQPAPIVHREIFEIFQKYFAKYFVKYFTPKKFMKFYITSHDPCSISMLQNYTHLYITPLIDSSDCMHSR